MVGETVQLSVATALNTAGVNKYVLPLRLTVASDAAQALLALSVFAEQCGAAFAGGGEAARVATASAWAAQERSIAELGEILQGVHFLDMPNAGQVLSREFCARLAAATSPDELAALLGAACDLSAQN